MELPDFSAARVLVVGDVMLDRYWHGGTERISPEAPVPVVRVEREEGRPGGAANVALNVAALGGGVVLIGVTGDDEQARILEKQLAETGVDCCFEPVPALSALYDHGKEEFIVSVHLLKTVLAARAETRALAGTSAGALTAAAVNRFLNSPLKRKHVRRTAHQAMQFVAKDF